MQLVLEQFRVALLPWQVSLYNAEKKFQSGVCLEGIDSAIIAECRVIV